MKTAHLAFALVWLALCARHLAARREFLRAAEAAEAEPDGAGRADGRAALSRYVAGLHRAVSGLSFLAAWHNLFEYLAS